MVVTSSGSIPKYLGIRIDQESIPNQFLLAKNCSLLLFHGKKIVKKNRFLIHRSRNQIRPGIVSKPDTPDTFQVHKIGNIYLGGPPLVKAATGEVVTGEELGE